MTDNTQAKALEVFGADRQVDKCIEELAELATVLVKYRHGEATAEQVIDELADVEITTGTLRLLFDRQAIETRVLFKLSRLSRLVADQVAAKPEPKPVKPATCWTPWQRGYNLHCNGRWLGFAYLANTMWVADYGNGDAKWFGTATEAMRAIEQFRGLPEVPVWKP